MSIDFFELLYSSDEFCATAGRLTLASSRLENAIKSYLHHHGVNIPNQKATLGKLVTHLKEHKLITPNGAMHFDDLILKRNYVTHSLYDLLSGNIPRTILENQDLQELDVYYYTDKLQDTVDDLFYFSRLFKDKKTQVCII